MKKSKALEIIRAVSILSSLLVMIVSTWYVVSRDVGEVRSTPHVVLAVSSYEGQPDNFVSVAETADIIVEGVVEKVLPAKWTTQDGKMPKEIENLLSGASKNEGPTDSSVSDSTPLPLLQPTSAPTNALEADPRGLNPNHQIRTPVLFSVQKVFKGENVKDKIIFSVLGGTVDDVTMDAGEGVYKPGAHLIVFLYRGKPDSAPAKAHVDALFPSMPLVIDGNIAHGPIRDISVVELVEQIQESLNQ